MEHVSEEDYLRAIYSLSEKNKEQGVKVSKLAEQLGITKASVSAMADKLEKKKLLKAEPYSPLFLTKKGLKEANRITHNYRVIEVFLTEILDYNKTNVRKEAHRMEHSFSDKSIRKLDMFLNNPKTCPHGKKIH